MEERKSMGSALVDVFDAGVVLVKAEINGVVKKVGEVAKAKGVGVVLLLGAIGPLLLGLIFLILFLFYGLMRLGMGAWAAALLVALVSMALAGAMALLGIQQLGSEVDTGLPTHPVDLNEINGTVSGVPVSGVPVSGVPVYGAPVSAAAVPLASVQYAAPGSVSYGAVTATAHTASHGHAHHDDPNLQNPVVIQGAPGISVSTDPTFREDMKKEGY